MNHLALVRYTTPFSSSTPTRRTEANMTGIKSSSKNNQIFVAVGVAVALVMVLLVAGFGYILMRTPTSKNTGPIDPSPASIDSPAAVETTADSTEPSLGEPSVETEPAEEVILRIEEIAASPPVYVALTEESKITRLSDPPEPVSPKFSQQQYKAWGDEVIGKAGLEIRPRPGYPLPSADVPATVLSPFLRLDPIDGQDYWQFRITETAPLTYIASPEERGSRDEIVVIVEHNHYGDIDAFNQAFWHERVDGIFGEGHRLVAASQIEPIDDSGTRFQFSVTGGSRRHVACLVIHHRGRVYLLHAVSDNRDRLVNIHQRIANSTAIDVPQPGQVARAVQDDINGFLTEVVRLAEANETEKLIELMAHSFRYSLLMKDPDQFKGFIELIRSEQPKLIQELQNLDYSKAIYNEHIGQLVYPASDGKNLRLDKEGDAWRML